MTDPVCTTYALGPRMIAVESLLALRELLNAVRAGRTARPDVADNRPIQEEGHATIRTAGGEEMESTADRHARFGDTRATGTSAGPDGVTDSGSAPDRHGAEPSV